jgi:hypothetical protein
MNCREGDSAIVDYMLGALIQGWADQYPDDDFQAVRQVFEAKLAPLMSDYGRKLVKDSFDQCEAFSTIARAASAAGGSR